MQYKLPVRKRIRLARPTYDGWQAFAVTACTTHRRKTFVPAENVDEAIGALDDATTKFETHVLAYCFMPDHVHLLLEGRCQTNMMDFVKLFKQLAGYRFKQRTGQKLWQKGYHDRIVRLEEDLVDYAGYIFANPVRKGLVSDPWEWPFSGGEYFQHMWSPLGVTGVPKRDVTGGLEGTPLQLGASLSE